MVCFVLGVEEAVFDVAPHLAELLYVVGVGFDVADEVAAAYFYFDVAPGEYVGGECVAELVVECCW